MMNQEIKFLKNKKSLKMTVISFRTRFMKPKGSREAE